MMVKGIANKRDVVFTKMCSREVLPKFVQVAVDNSDRYVT
jgi:hypothetical protein